MFAIHDYELRGCSSYYEAERLYVEQAAYFGAKPAPAQGVTALAVPLRDDGQHRKKYYLVKDRHNRGANYQFWYENNCILEWMPYNKVVFDNAGYHTRSTQAFANRFLPTRVVRVGSDASAIEVEMQHLTKTVRDSMYVYHKGDVITLKTARKRDPAFRGPDGYRKFILRDTSCTITVNSNIKKVVHTPQIGLQRNEFVREPHKYVSIPTSAKLDIKQIMRGLEDFFAYAKFIMSFEGGRDALPRPWMSDRQIVDLAMNPPSSEFYPDMLGGILYQRSSDYRGTIRRALYEHFDCYTTKYLGFGQLP